MMWCNRYPGCGCGTQSGPHSCEGDRPPDDGYTDDYVAQELARLSEHTSDELQSRIQEVFMWLRERKP